MKAFWTSALSMIAFLAHAASAQQPPHASDQPAIPQADVLAEMCSPAGALEYAFGQTGVPGSTRLETLLGNGIAAPAASAPFRTLQPRSTEWSGRFMQMSYSVPVADEDKALRFINAIGNALEEAGWHYVNLPDEEAPIYLLGVAGYATLEWPVETDSGSSRVLVGLDYMMGELVMTCARDDLLRVHAEEAFGRLPPGTPRPMVPEIEIPEIISQARCSDPELIAKLETMLESGKFADGFLSAMVDRARYRDRLTIWLLWKLEQSGKITTEELLDKSMASVSDGSPDGNPFAALELLAEMQPIAERISRAEKARDPKELCRSLVPLHEWIERVDAITSKQTEAVQNMLVREAQRLNVSID